MITQTLKLTSTLVLAIVCQVMAMPVIAQDSGEADLTREQRMEERRAEMEARRAEFEANNPETAALMKERRAEMETRRAEFEANNPGVVAEREARRAERDARREEFKANNREIVAEREASRAEFEANHPEATDRMKDRARMQRSRGGFNRDQSPGRLGPVKVSNHLYC